MERRTLSKAITLSIIPLAGCTTYTISGELNLEVSVDAPEYVEYRHVGDSIGRGLISTSGSVEGEIILQSNDISSIEFQSAFYAQESRVDSIKKIINPESENFDQGHVEKIYLNLDPDSEPTRYEVILNVDRI